MHIFVSLVLIELFQTRKQMTFPPRLTVLTDAAQVRTSFCFVIFGSISKTHSLFWPLPSEIGLLFKADKSLILMLGSVIFWLLIMAICAADSANGSVSLTILYSCWISSVSSKEKAVHLQQPRRLRHRLLWVRIHRIGNFGVIFRTVFVKRGFLLGAKQRRCSPRSSPGLEPVDEEAGPGQQGLEGLTRQRWQWDVQDQKRGPTPVQADGARDAYQEGGRHCRESVRDCHKPDQILLGGPLPRVSPCLPRISV